MTQVFLCLLCLAVAYIIKTIKEEKQNQKNIQIQQLRIVEEKKKVVTQKIKKVDTLDTELQKLGKMQICDISEFKKSVLSNENIIIEKGGDSILFSFLKIDSFLNDYYQVILDDKKYLSQSLDVKLLKKRIKDEENRNEFERNREQLHDRTLMINGHKPIGFDAKLSKLLDATEQFVPTMEAQIKTLDFYHNLGIAMLVFYLNDKKINYFEIFQAFEKLGVFDSSWQKNVLKKLDSIDERLGNLNNNIIELNSNFSKLLESSENIVKELKVINSSITTNNMLTAITAYQTWRVKNKL